MSYQVIARKWRSQTFDELVGQSHIRQTLLNSLRHDRLPHALLFTGPRGTGKTSTARILAKSLRCPNAKDFVPCGVCSECIEISESRSVDVLEIDGASNNGVESIRELRETVGFMPASGKRKVYIIDEVHMLSTSAFNALLKTLEEPPPHVVFIMATTEAQKIPNTILSRCQRYDFRKIATKLIAEHLIKICAAENVQAAPEAVWSIARQGEGSMRDAQSLLDQVISFAQGDLSLAKVIDVLGLTDRALLTRTLTALATGGELATAEIVSIIEAVFLAGYDPIVFMKDLLEELRNLLLAKVSSDRAEDMIDLPKEDIERLREIGSKLNEEDIHLLFDMALKGAGDLHRAQDTRVVLEMILLRMSIAPKFASLESWASRAGSNAGAQAAANAPAVSTATVAVTRPNSTAATVAPTPAPVPSPARPPSAPQTQHTNLNSFTRSPTPPPPAQPLAEKWIEFVDRVRKVNGKMAAELDQLHLASLNGQDVTIGVSEKHQFLLHQVSDQAFVKKVVNYLNTFWGPGHTAKIQSVGAAKIQANLSPVNLQEKKKNDERQELVRKVEDHPLVREAKTIFNSQIKSIRGSES